MKKIISIDPGSLKVGIGILHNDMLSNKIILNKSIQLPLKGKELYHRFNFLYDEVDKLCKEFEPEEMAIEETFVDKEFKYGIDAPLKLSMSRGVLYAVAGKYNMPCFEYNNKKIKQCICRNAGASKRMMIERISQMFKIEASEDEAMSIGVGITHILMQKSRNLAII